MVSATTTLDRLKTLDATVTRWESALLGALFLAGERGATEGFAEETMGCHRDRLQECIDHLYTLDLIEIIDGENQPRPKWCWRLTPDAKWLVSNLGEPTQP